MNNSPLNIPVIAIDGPSASGKGSVAELVAEQLGFHYLDSGAIYRIVAYASKQLNIPWDQADAIANLTAQLNIQFENGSILLNGNNITTLVRSEEMGRGASEVAVHPAVRNVLLDLQKNFRQSPGLVGDGRDMGSVIFPDAILKIFLTANVEIRAQRRYLQLCNRGLDANFETILEDLKTRDLRDSQRSAAPLKQMPDALLLDTSDRSIQQAVDFVLDAYKKSTHPYKKT